jgi:hypothetical protein
MCHPDSQNPWTEANEPIHDGCLKVDGDADPVAAPRTALLPIKLTFDNPAALDYTSDWCLRVRYRTVRLNLPKKSDHPFSEVEKRNSDAFLCEAVKPSNKPHHEYFQ